MKINSVSEGDYVEKSGWGDKAITYHLNERAELEEKLRVINRDYTMLLEMCKTLAESLELQKVLQISVDSITKLVGLDTAAIYLLEENILYLQATTPPLPSDFPEEMRSAPLVDHPHIQKAFHSHKPLFILDFSQVDLTPAERAIAEKRNLQTVLFVPLVMHEKPVGVFIVGSVGKPSALSNRRIELSRIWAGLSSLSLKNARLYEESEKNSLKNKKMLIERIEMMEQKNKLESQLQQTQKMEAIGILAGGIAHDFNNMLGGIMGAAELLGYHLPNDAKAKQLHQTILDSTTRAADLTKQLLAFSRQSVKATTTVNLHGVIQEIVALTKRTLNKQIIIEANLRAKTSCVMGDPSLLHNALLNLCINASQAMPEGGILRLNTQNTWVDEDYGTSSFKLQPGQYIEVEVQDNGCGIAQEHLGYIFEPFFTTKEQGKGTGLGLSSVYGTVQQHSGAINVYSELGKGTSFLILLPICEDAEKVLTNFVDIKKGSGCILVVDDEVIMRSTAKAILESLGYEVLMAEDGEKALEIYKREKGRIDLVLLDMIMPVMNGKVCFKKLRKYDPQARVMLSSGFSTEDDLQEMRRSGLKGFIRKPYLISTLSRSIFEALQEERG